MQVNWFFSCLKLSVPLLFFGYQFILRRWPGLMMDTMMEQFSVNSTKFGLLASMYYYGYAGMQLPIAFVMGRWEMRTVLCGCALLCALGLGVLTYTHELYWAMAAEFLIGSGSAAGFLCTAEAISLWFPKERYGQIMGLVVAFGLLGAVYGGQPIRGLLDQYDWQYIALGIIAIACVLAISALYLPSSIRSELKIPSQPAIRFRDGFRQILKNPVLIIPALAGVFRQVLKHPETPVLITLAIANFLMVGVLEGFADIWATPFLVQNYGLSLSDSAGITSWIFKGMMIGSPILCFLAKYLGNYTVIMGCGVGMSGAFFTLLYTCAPAWSLPFWFAALGVGCCYQVLLFVTARDWCPISRLGSGIAFLNAVNMLGGAFFHPTIGFLVDELKSTHTLVTTYRYALTVVPLCALIGTFIVGCVALYRTKTLSLKQPEGR